MRNSYMRRVTLLFVRVLGYAVAAVILVVCLAIGTLSTGWGKNQLRRLIVSQANQYLTATLEIGRLEGSLYRGLTLSDIRLSRDGRPLVVVDQLSIDYRLAELLRPGTVLREIRLTRPRVSAARQPDGRWNLAALLRRDARQGPRSGPGRPLHVLSIWIVDGDIELVDPLTFGAVHVPSRFDNLNAHVSLDYEPVETQVTVTNASWMGAGLTMERLAGIIANGRNGWTFRDLGVRTRQSEFTLSGRVDRSVTPTMLDLQVDARRFAFPEWSPVLPALRNIAVTSAFALRFKGTSAKLATDLTLQSDAGGVQGAFVLDTTVPGWHGAGQVKIDRLNLARWLNRANDFSDLSGRVQFDLDLDLGRRFPRGSYDVDLVHAAFAGYEGDRVRAHGTITADQALVSNLTATAYGSDLLIASGAIDIDAPFRFHFQGTDRDLDLRRVPSTIPVPRVESTLAFDYDVTGQFRLPFITGSARFDDSEFLGAAIGRGAIGFIDTSNAPVRYTGEGDVSGFDIGRVGQGLDVAWMQEPRWAGTVAGHFQMEGVGGEPGSMALRGGGRLMRADLFGGRLADADVTVNVADGSLDGSFDGSFSGIDPAIAFVDPNMAASLTGSGRARMSVRDLLLETPELTDYEVDGTAELQQSVIGRLALDRGSLSAKLAGGVLDIASLQVGGPQIEGGGSGRIELGAGGNSHFDYDIVRGDLSLAADRIGANPFRPDAHEGHRDWTDNRPALHRRCHGQGPRQRRGESALDRRAVRHHGALERSGPKRRPSDRPRHVR